MLTALLISVQPRWWVWLMRLLMGLSYEEFVAVWIEDWP